MATYNGVILDPFQQGVTRPVQTRGGFEIDVIAYVVPRPVQKFSGYFFEPTSQSSGGDTIQTPRKTPLESTWKRANATAFE